MPCTAAHGATAKLGATALLWAAVVVQKRKKKNAVKADEGATWVEEGVKVDEGGHREHRGVQLQGPLPVVLLRTGWG